MTRIAEWKRDALLAVRNFEEAMGDVGRLEGINQIEWHMLWERWQAVRPRAPLEELPGWVARPFLECLFASPVELKAFREWAAEEIPHG